MSRETKYEPLPWYATDRGLNGDAGVWASDGDMVADVYGNLAYDSEGMDRANLIAAAPEMYSALTKLRDAIGETSFGSPLMYAVLEANKALAKATPSDGGKP